MKNKVIHFKRLHAAMLNVWKYICSKNMRDELRGELRDELHDKLRDEFSKKVKIENVKEGEENGK